MFAPPYVYLHGTPILNVLGRAVPVPIDSMIVFIGCPESRDMSCVATTEAPWPGYAAQKLFGAWGWFDPPCSGNDAGAIYTEYMETGQCVFLNFDLSASLTEMSRYCDGNPPDPAPDFIPGYYHGRVALLRFILWDIFGLPVEASAGVSEINDDRAAFSWDLLQNTPNPCLSSTEIKFEVACRGRVSIKVYNTAGQLVKVLKDEHMMPGHYSVAWDGRSRAGQRVAGGVYFYRMTAGQFSTARKVIVIGN